MGNRLGKGTPRSQGACVRTMTRELMTAQNDQHRSSRVQGEQSLDWNLLPCLWSSTGSLWSSACKSSSCSINSWLFLFSRSVMLDSLWPHGVQHTRLPCPSPSPRACSNSCPLSQWYHPTISSCCPLFLPWIFSSIRVFSNESTPAVTGKNNIRGKESHWIFQSPPNPRPLWTSSIYNWGPAWN